MPELDLRETSSVDLRTGTGQFKIVPEVLDVSGGKEFPWDNPHFTEYLGYFNSVPEFRASILTLAMWATGRGWTASPRDTLILERIRGWGEDTIDSIWMDAIAVKKFNGDSYAEIINNDTNTLINLKKLNPQTVRQIVDQKGMILRYEEIDPISKETKRRIPTTKMFHLCNDRIASQIHGTSEVPAVKSTLDALNEAIADTRRTLHNSTVRFILVDSHDQVAYDALSKQWKTAIKDGSVVLAPKDTTEFPDVKPLSTAEHRDWIKYLENKFYLNIKVPKLILGGSAEHTEGSGKMGYLTWEQPWRTEQRLLEQDIWNQLAIRIKFNRPVSLKGETQETEAANPAAVSTQTNDTQAGVGA